MATDKQIDAEKIIDAADGGYDIDEEIEQAYRNAYADGFSGCMAIIEEWAKQTPSNAKGMLLAHDLLKAYYNTRLSMWRIGSIDKDIPPPDFFKTHS